jgi:acyl carrier protein
LSHLPYLNTLRQFAIAQKEANHEQISPGIAFVPEKKHLSAQQRSKFSYDTVNIDATPSHLSPGNDLPGSLSPGDKEEVLLWLQNEMTIQIGASLNIDSKAILANQIFHSLGIDSLKAIEILGNVGNLFDISLSPILLYEYPTIEKLAANLLQNHEDKIIKRYIKANNKGTDLAPVTDAPQSDIKIQFKANKNTEIKDNDNLEKLSEKELAQLLAHEIENNHLSRKKNNS